MKDIKILAFGEILWDVFPDERKIGGAPFNFAAHCSKLGANVDFITSVGNDDNGKDALSYFERYGISDKFVSVSNLPTGHCDVTLTDGIPEYKLVFPVAYDDIRVSDDKCLTLNSYDCIYCGTLALRNETSRNTLFNILKKCDTKLILDVNIRQSFYSSGLLEKLFDRTSVIKISREELPTVAKELHLPYENDSFVRKVFETYSSVDLIALTLDKDGAIIYERNGNRIESDKPQGKVVSTVGAGDSFTAAFIVNYLYKSNIADCLDKAVKLSDFVVGYTGAIPDYDPNQFIKEIYYV